MTEPLDVSVVIPAYNAERFLERCVRSVLAQTLPPREVLIVDDGSTDRTAEVARSFGGSVRCVRQENGGASAARNRGIQEATGEWIAFLDCDDTWEPQRLARGYAILERHPSLVWVAGRYRVLLPDGRCLMQPEGTAYRAAFAREGSFFPDFYQGAALGAIFSTCAMLIRRDIVLRAGLFDMSLKRGEDLDLWYRIADEMPAIGYAEKPLFLYDKTRQNSLTGSSAGFTSSLLILLQKHAPSPDGRAGVSSKEVFFRSLIRVFSTEAIRTAPPGELRELLKRYGALMSPARRRCMRITTILPTRARSWLLNAAFNIKQRWFPYRQLPNRGSADHEWSRTKPLGNDAEGGPLV